MAKIFSSLTMMLLSLLLFVSLAEAQRRPARCSAACPARLQKKRINRRQKRKQRNSNVFERNEIVLCEIATQKSICTSDPTGLLRTGNYNCGACDLTQSCPEAGKSLVLQDYQFRNSLELAPSVDGTLCTLTIVSNSTNGIVPVARSYEGHDWEAAGGLFARMTFECSGNCQARVPLELSQAVRERLAPYTFVLTTFTDTNEDSRTIAARFLEKTTFGPTMDEINSFTNPAAWVKDQMTNVAISSHRAYFRKRLNQRYVSPSVAGLVTHPCQAGTRYRKYAWTRKDKDQTITLKTVDGKKVWFRDGVVRTVLAGVTTVEANERPWSSESASFVVPDGDYVMCSQISERVGTDGDFKIDLPEGCFYVMYNGERASNTAVFYDNTIQPTNPVVDLDGHVRAIEGNFYGDEFGSQELYLESNVTSCPSDVPDVTGLPTYHTVGKLGNEYWIHDPRFVWDENTLDSPAPDGGGSAVATTASFTNRLRKATCINVARNFLNENDCQVTDEPNTCGEVVVAPSATVDLTVENFETVYNKAGRYVYAVTGLRQEAGMDDPPCAHARTSRWLRVTGDCSMTTTTKTHDLLATLLTSAGELQTNANLRDVFFPRDDVGVACDQADSDKLDFRVQADGACWQNVHKDWLQVYDFSIWVEQHPGGPTKIQQFAEDSGNYTLAFPSWHEMDRWYSNKWRLADLGRLGDSVRAGRNPGFATAFSELVGAADLTRTNIVCGSPNEVANDPSLDGEGVYGASTYFNKTTGNTELIQQRTSVWLAVALKGSDQLRQRVAWILSQILVVAPGDLTQEDQSEKFLAYYDIFVRNAFGNYRDILKEVAYSPLMAEMLSYLDSQSTAIIWKNRRRVEYADENFAREIMQLFSIGLVKLNDDGTTVQQDGKDLLTYTNGDITEYARLWTGFKRQKPRGNIEDNSYDGKNLVDPMLYDISARDPFPKMGLNRQYIGDGVVLCSDLPKQHFLKKGAVYRLLGNVPSPLFTTDDEEFLPEEDSVASRLQVEATSPLGRKLCGDGGTCQPSVKVELNEDVECEGDMSCEGTESPRIIEIDGTFFEYTRPSCVYQSFYDGQIMKRYTYIYVCGDPRTEVGGIVCCPENAVATRDRDSFASQLFDGERGTYKLAKDRCAGQGQEICHGSNHESCEGCNDGQYYWSHQTCGINAKINPAGQVAIVHNTNTTYGRTNRFLQEDTKTFFRVDWSTEPDLSTSDKYLGFCTSQGCSIEENDFMCVCPTMVEDTIVFSSKPSREEVLEMLHIGAIVPSLFSRQDLGNGVNMHSRTGAYDIDSVFEVIDDNGITQLRKNVVSTVFVGSTGSDNLSFRNPPHFVSLYDPEIRDAQAETDAGLDHFFRHPNVAPFLALRFAQRFGYSNPSPRFIATIAAAFRTGRYVDFSSGERFGNGEYGNLEAMVAAVLLDREASTQLLDKDPVQGSLLEPFLKYVRVMRSMEFTTAGIGPKITIAADLMSKIGQQAHELPSVFSFFLPEYSPPGSLGEGGLVCPECQVLTGPKSISLVNGLTSLLKYGLENAYGGFGMRRVWNENDRVLGVTDSPYSLGHLDFEASRRRAVAVDELALLLTSGRLEPSKRAYLAKIYKQVEVEKSAKEASIYVQQLIVSCPEFHTNSRSPRTSTTTAIPEKIVLPPQKPYKAVIYLMLAGGIDSYNVLVPYACTGKNSMGQTVREQYDTERGIMALTRSELEDHVISASGQPCSQFAVHPEFTVAKELYNDNDLLFMANVGVVGEGGMTKSDYQYKTPVQLFAHNAMEKEAKTVDPNSLNPGTGVLGRLSTVLTKKGYSVNAVTIDENSVTITPEVGSEGPAPLIFSSEKVETFDRKPEAETEFFNLTDHVGRLNGEREGHSSLFGEKWSEVFLQGISDADFLQKILANTTFGDQWPGDNSFPMRRYRSVAQMMQTKRDRGSERDLFFLNQGGWDHHSDMKNRMKTEVTKLNECLEMLVEELKLRGLWESTTVVLTSDFARTITPNSGKGSDHAWGGHYMMMGGDVDGGKIVGNYPDDLTTNGPLNIDRGRIIPDTAWDAVWNGISEWMGASGDEELDYIMPNRGAVSSGGFTPLFRHSDLYKSQDTPRQSASVGRTNRRRKRRNRGNSRN